MKMYTKQLWCFAILFGFTLSCSQAPFIDHGYGDKVLYGTHVGIDYGLPIGTPIIACSDGEVIAIYEPGNAYYEGGTSIRIIHTTDNKDNPTILSIYAHLSQPMVSLFERVKRGQLIGLSGESNNFYPHLHFQLMKPGTLDEMKMSNTYNPKKFAINGALRCFDPNRDYSEFSEIEITLPIPCGEHKKELISIIKQQFN